jgi:hypothetical protein
VLQKKAPAPDTGNYEVLGSSQLDYTIVARQEIETGYMAFSLLQKAETVSVPNEKQVPARTLAAPQKIRIAHVPVFAG